MKSTTRVPGYIPIMAIGYKSNPRKVPGFIDTEGEGSTDPGYPYLSSSPGNSSNVSIFLVVFPHMLGIYFNACNTIDNHKRMHKSYPEL